MRPSVSIMNNLMVALRFICYACILFLNGGGKSDFIEKIYQECSAELHRIYEEEHKDESNRLEQG